MLNKTKIALAAALIFGSASAVLAGEGSPDINVPKGYGSVAPQQAPFRGDVLDAYASTQRQVRPARNPAVRPFTAQEKELFDRETGTGDGY